MNAILVVMRKELKEILRDKRVRTNTLFMPAVIMLGMLSMISFIMGVGEKKNQIVHVIKADNQFVQKMKADKVNVVEVASEADGEKLIKAGKARVVLEFEPDFDAKVKAGKQTPIQAFYDPQQDTANMTLAVLNEYLASIDGDQAEVVLKAHHIEKSSLAPASIVKREIKVGESTTSASLIGLLPYIIVLYAFVGGLGPASDTVAGEKEKQTLETLLITPVKRTEIAIGKFLSLAIICYCGSTSALMGVVLAGVSKAPMYSKLFQSGLGLNGVQIATMMLVLIPTVAFFASMLIAVSAFAKNTREAQSSMGLISIVVIMPAVFGQIIGLTDLASNWWIRLVPVLNTSVTLRECLQGKTDAAGILMTIATDAILALIGIRIAVHLFKREEVLTRV